MIATLETQRIETLLATRIGLDPAAIGRDEIERSVRHRMQQTGCQTVSEYLRLAEHGDEWDELVELVLVRETWFFREPTAFKLLEDRARQHVARGAHRVFRALSMPCSTGAEPYSIAMTFRDAGLSPDRFRVEAVDLSRQALEEARRGVYGARAVRLVPRPALQAHFLPAGNEWQLSADARKGVRLSRGNVVDPDVLRGAAPFDVVFCRNVLIYLAQAARERLLATLWQLLKDDGVLVTGHAETLNVVAPRFVSAGVPRTFAYVKAPASHGRGTPPGVWSIASVSRSPHGHGRPAASSAAPSIVPAPRRTGSAPVAAEAGGVRERELDQIRHLADMGRLAEAIDRCKAWLDDHPSSIDGQFLMGVAASAAGRIDLAESALRRALYLDPSHEGALLHLAAIRARSGNVEEAARLRSRVRTAVVRAEPKA